VIAEPDDLALLPPPTDDELEAPAAPLHLIDGPLNDLVEPTGIAWFDEPIADPDLSTEPTADELPGGPRYEELLAEAKAIAEANPLDHWNRASPEERERIVTAAAIGRRRAEAQARRAGFASMAEYLAATEAGEPGAGESFRAERPAMVGIDAADLLALELAPLRWIVPDVIPEGTTIVASPPKVGKSCLVYQVVVEVAVGGELFGRRVTPGSALYLALEDGQRRGQDRLRAALAGRTMPRGRLEVRWSCAKLGDGLEAELRAWLDCHADAAVVAIDTLGKVRAPTNGKRGAYEVDVEDLGRLQELFRDRDVALIVVHHARKQAGDDFLASVSGTYGITGSADTIVSLQRPRLEAFGNVLVTGRDVPDAKIPVRFDGLTWTSAPESLPEASFERLEVYRVIEESGPIFPAAIAARVGLERTSVQHMVARLVDNGAVARTAKGYVVAEGARANLSPHHSVHSGSDDSDLSERGHVRVRPSPSLGDELAGIFEGALGEPEDVDAEEGYSPGATDPDPDPMAFLRRPRSATFRAKT
jgi:hypothetical protein